MQSKLKFAFLKIIYIAMYKYIYISLYVSFTETTPFIVRINDADKGSTTDRHGNFVCKTYITQSQWHTHTGNIPKKKFQRYNLCS